MAQINQPGIFDFIQSDKRIIEQKLRRHQLSRQEHQKFLKTIPDEKDQAEESKVMGSNLDPQAHSG